ncbi:MAG TPA: hypothetical protein VHR72_09980 [Gemmataceae bacterium]|nr:hypothetical protein [Gemmataceae bacterium]
MLQAVSDPKWTVNGIRNRELAAELFGDPPADVAERRRRSAKVSRLLRLLRGHGILQKVANTHRYQVTDKTRDALHAILAARSANTEKLAALAA